MILEHSTKPLSLRRVPPNLLVGIGATDFAHEIGMPLVSPEYLVSAAAGERYARWKSDLGKAGPRDDSESDGESDAPTSKTDNPESAHNLEAPELAGTWNESQPFSPRTIPADPPNQDYPFGVDSMFESPRRRDFWSSNEPGNDGQSSVRTRNADEESSIDEDPIPLRRATTLRAHVNHSPNRSSEFYVSSDDGGCQLPAPLIQPPPTRAVSPSMSQNIQLSGHDPRAQGMNIDLTRPDNITDTVGAIAVDCFGNIAAGSSSGGIGMKHKGRVGPAALVGIGTAVIPIEPEDKDRTSVATVTSGTGEHMATTMAAGTCASRLYTSSRKIRTGGSESIDDDNAIRGFVERDFMGMNDLTLLHRCY